MIAILKEWEGHYEIDGKIYENLDDVQYKDGEEFHVKLLPNRSEKKDD